MHILLSLSSVLSDPGSSDQRVDSGVNLLPSTLSDDGAPWNICYGKTFAIFYALNLLLLYHDKNLIFFHIENAAHFVLLLVCCLGEFQNMNFCCKNCCCVLAVECRRWIQISSALKCLAVKDSACLGFPWQPVAFCTSDKGCLWRIGFYVNDIWIFFLKVQFFYLICLQNIRVLQ